MLSTLRRAALGAALCLAGSVTAQVVPVNNTGCPGFAPPQWQGAPNLGQQIAFSLQRRPSPRSFVFVAMGYASGGGIPFDLPFTCVQGPCVWYLAPFGGEYALVSDTFLATLALRIPNDRALLFQTFSIQGGNVEGFGNCITLSQALSFAIGP
jgi:hypothetical protein